MAKQKPSTASLGPLPEYYKMSPDEEYVLCDYDEVPPLHYYVGPEAPVIVEGEVIAGGAYWFNCTENQVYEAIWGPPGSTPVWQATSSVTKFVVDLVNVSDAVRSLGKIVPRNNTGTPSPLPTKKLASFKDVLAMARNLPVDDDE